MKKGLQSPQKSGHKSIHNCIFRGRGPRVATYKHCYSREPHIPSHHRAHGATTAAPNSPPLPSLSPFLTTLVLVPVRASATHPSQSAIISPRPAPSYSSLRLSVASMRKGRGPSCRWKTSGLEEIYGGVQFRERNVSQSIGSATPGHKL
jgi:hypothetical protein